MSRTVLHSSLNTLVEAGKNNDVGEYLQIQDERWASDPREKTGEGIVLAWNSKDGFVENKIGAELSDLSNLSELLRLTDNFCAALKQVAIVV